MAVDRSGKRAKSEERSRNEMPKQAQKTQEVEGTRRPLLLRLIVWLLALVFSPLVVFFMLFKVGEPVPRKWVASLSILLFICIGLTWTAAAFVDNVSSSSLSILQSYSTARIEVRKLPFSQLINTIGNKYDVDPSLVAAIISQESGFQAEEVANRGTKGLMQISSDIWREYMPSALCKGDHAAPECSEKCIFNPNLNIEVGTMYFRDLAEALSGNIEQALATYNLGIMPVKVYSQSEEVVNESSNGLIASEETDGQPNEQTVSEGTVESENLSYTYDAINVQNVETGFTPNVLQKWINNRSETIEARISLIVMAKKARTVLSYMTLAFALVIMCWVVFKYNTEMAALHRNAKNEEKG